MSRKLIFAAGLAHVFWRQLDPAADSARSELIKARDVSHLTAYLADQLANPPLETIARLCLNLMIPDETTRSIFDNYDRFLGILDDFGKRQNLEEARSHDELRGSAAWREIREVSQPFHEALVHLFLRDNEDLQKLTMSYGYFDATNRLLNRSDCQGRLPRRVGHYSSSRTRRCGVISAPVR